MADLSVVGTSVPRVDGLDKVTGNARYTADFTLPRVLHGKVLRSPYPHARILGIDTSRAAAIPGVKAVVTGKDAPNERMGVFLERPIIAPDVVRFVGEAVAAVAAETPEIAEEALDAIDVQYEELEPVFDPEEAMKPNPRIVLQAGHAQLPRISAYANLPVLDIADPTRPNIYYRYHLEEGDVEKGFQEADLILEKRYDVTRMQHCCMEPHAAMAQIDPQGNITVWASEQHPHEARGYLSRIFGVSPSKVRVISPYIGGGFGGKLFVMAMPVTILLALKTGRPVKLVYTREETFVDGITDIPMIVHVKDGVKKDGRLVARKIEAILNCGAYAGRVVMITENVATGAAIVYKIPNFQWDSYAVATNEPPAGPLRGFGGVQLVFALETQMDILAEKLGMDPAEFRRKNFFKQGEENLLGMVTDNIAVEQTMDNVSRWLKKDEEKHQVKGPWKKGTGFGLEGKTGLVSSYSLAAVKVMSDGTVELRHSATEGGMGSNTAMAQIAAEEFGTTMKKIKTVFSDTALTPFDIVSTANLTTFSTGNAVRLACQDAKRQIFDIAAARLQVAPGDLYLKDSEIYVKDKDTAPLKLSDVFHPGGRGTVNGGELIGQGVYKGRNRTKEQIEKCWKKNVFTDYQNTFGSTSAEVAVNEETGEVRVLRMGQSHDVAQPINVKACEAQIDGGTGMGIGRTLFEDMLVENGVTLNPNFVDYKIPSMAEIPTGEDSAAIVAGTPHPDGPYGAKGFGESTNCAVAPAITNAIYKAVGIRFNSLPVTREKMLEGLKAAREVKKS